MQVLTATAPVPANQQVILNVTLKDIGEYVCADMCTTMCTDTWSDMCTGNYRGMCVRALMSEDMSVDMFLGSCAGIRVNRYACRLNGMQYASVGRLVSR